MIQYNLFSAEKKLLLNYFCDRCIINYYGMKFKFDC